MSFHDFPFFENQIKSSLLLSYTSLSQAFKRVNIFSFFERHSIHRCEFSENSQNIECISHIYAITNEKQENCGEIDFNFFTKNKTNYGIELPKKSSLESNKFSNCSMKLSITAISRS